MRVASLSCVHGREQGEECTSVQKVEAAFSVYVQTSLFPTLLEMNHTTEVEETCQPLLSSILDKNACL